MVGEFIAHLIVEIKAVSHLTKIHEAQFGNYLVSAGKDMGLLINFGPEKVTLKRKIRLFE